jgi:hypothetical protein
LAAGEPVGEVLRVGLVAAAPVVREETATRGLNKKDYFFYFFLHKFLCQISEVLKESKQ